MRLNTTVSSITQRVESSSTDVADHGRFHTVSRSSWIVSRYSYTTSAAGFQSQCSVSASQSMGTHLSRRRSCTSRRCCGRVSAPALCPTGGTYSSVSSAKYDDMAARRQAAPAVHRGLGRRRARVESLRRQRLRGLCLRTGIFDGSSAMLPRLSLSSLRDANGGGAHWWNSLWARSHADARRRTHQLA